MAQLTKNIWSHELECQCGQCEVTIQDWEPIIILVQKCCNYFAKKYGVEKVRLDITSAARCSTWNRVPIELGGPGSTDGSQHIRCKAMDIRLFVSDEQIPPREVYEYFDRKYSACCGIGLYNSFTHFDDRVLKKRWGI